MLQSVGPQGVGRDLATEQQQQRTVLAHSLHPELPTAEVTMLTPWA